MRTALYTAEAEGVGPVGWQEAELRAWAARFPDIVIDRVVHDPTPAPAPSTAFNTLLFDMKGGRLDAIAVTSSAVFAADDIVERAWLVHAVQRHQGIGTGTGQPTVAPRRGHLFIVDPADAYRWGWPIPDDIEPDVLELRRLLDRFAQLERARLKDAMAAGRALRLAREGIVSVVPYGWLRGDRGELVDDRPVQVIIGRGRTLIDVHKAPLRVVCEYFTQAGFIPRKRSHNQALMPVWTPYKVKNLYAGPAGGLPAVPLDDLARRFL